MKATDPDIWEQQRAELTADGEIGQAFLAFLEAWVDEAETTIKAIEDEGHELCPPDYASALSAALAPTEAKLGRIGTGYLGQVLAVIVIHWESGKDLVEGLTPIELRLVQDITALKIASQAESATTEGEPHE